MAANGSMMSEWKLRELMCEIGRRVYAKGFAAANDGNISYRLSEDRVLCTPTRVSKGFMKPDDLCIVDMDGKQVSGNRKRSSEILLHLAILKAAARRPGRASIATRRTPRRSPSPTSRSPSASSPSSRSSSARWRSPSTRRPATQAFAETVLPYVKDTETILLANHGTITYGADLEDAYFKTEIIDAYCRILLLSKQLGHDQLLLRRQGGRADQDQAGPGHSPTRGSPSASRTATSAATASSARATRTSSPSTRRSSPPSSRISRRARARRATARPERPARRRSDFDALVRTITDQVMHAMNGEAGSNGSAQGKGTTSVVDGKGYASGISGGM